MNSPLGISPSETPSNDPLANLAGHSIFPLALQEWANSSRHMPIEGSAITATLAGPPATSQKSLPHHSRLDKGMVARYHHMDETIKGFGHGGSESLTIFLQKPGRGLFVRKVLSERLVTPQWARDGRDVMLPPCPKAKRQIDYLQNLPDIVKPLFPEVLDITERRQIVPEGNERTVYQESIYDMTYVPGIEVSRFIEQYRPSPKVVAALYCVIFCLLRETVHAHRRREPQRPTLEQSYFNKIEKRLKLSQTTAPQTFSDTLLKAEEIIVNGVSLRNSPLLLKLFRGNAKYLEILEPRFHTLVVGDTNTENIKIGNILPLLQCGDDFSFQDIPFTAQELQIGFLDPRAIGFHEHGLDTGADDPMYDNKPWHNSLGNYDKIHGEHFDLDYATKNGVPDISLAFHEQNPYEASYQDIEKHFSAIMKISWKLDSPDCDYLNDRYWLIRFVFMMGTHFLAMPPFHFSKDVDGLLVDDAAHQKRPLAIYVEGIKWLNLALDMLEGKITMFHGLPVPEVDARKENSTVAG